MSEIPEDVLARAAEARDVKFRELMHAKDGPPLFMGRNDMHREAMRAAARVIAEHVRAEERAAVVAHLRMTAEFEYGLSNIVDAIETGEHVK